jgi:hypothetical protein
MTTTDAYAWVHFRQAPPELYLVTATDGNVTELVSQSAAASIGDVAGQVIMKIESQVSDGSILTYMQLTDSSGGQTWQSKSGERFGGKYGNLNLCADPLNIYVERGMTLNVLTAD